MQFYISQIMNALGWAMLHSFWQGAIIAMAVYFFRRGAAHLSANRRFQIQFTALILCFVSFLATFSLYLTIPTSYPTLANYVVENFIDSTGPETALSQITPGLVEGHLGKITPALGVLWCLGFIVISIFYSREYKRAQSLRHQGLTLIPEVWETRFADLLSSIDLQRPVEFFISAQVAEPVTLGVLKPIILVPVSFFTSMPVNQIEAILLHELAHIRRHDYGFHLLQTFINAIFFYHPAIEYISKKIDIDREYACDDFAARQHDDPDALIRGLATIRLGSAENNFALAANGKPHISLLARLQRLTGKSVHEQEAQNLLIPLLGFSLFLLAVISINPLTTAEAKRVHITANEQKVTPAENGEYYFTTVWVDGKEVTAKITADGNRWIYADGNWYDLDHDAYAQKLISKLPKLSVGQPPQAPVPPEPPIVPTRAAFNDDDYSTIDDKEFAMKIAQYDVEMQYFEEDLQRFERQMQSYTEQLSTQWDEQDVENILRQRDQIERSAEIARERADDLAEIWQLRADRLKEKADQMRKRAEEQAERQRLRHETGKTALLAQLKKDGLIKSRTDNLKITFPDGKMYVNHHRVPENIVGNYCSILSNLGVEKKTGSYIVMKHKGQSITIRSVE
ncbi:MAG: M56 family metallopeptidase [bacterium]